MLLHALSCSPPLSIKATLSAQLPAYQAAREAADLLAVKAKTNYLDLLPAELLGEIFLYATYNSPNAQFVIASVCRWWRELSIADSRLWSRLRLGRKRVTEMTLLWRERSKGKLRELTLAGCPGEVGRTRTTKAFDSDLRPGGLYALAFATLEPSLSQVEKLELCLGPASLWAPSRHSCWEAKFVNLRTITCVCLHDASGYEGHWNILAALAPQAKLETLNIKGMAFSFARPLGPSHRDLAASLKHLIIDDITLYDSETAILPSTDIHAQINFLSQTNELQTLVIRNSKWMSAPEGSAVLQLTSLNVLDMRGMSGGPLDPSLWRFSPSLTILDLGRNRIGGEAFPHIFAQILDSHGISNLRSLNLDHTYLPRLRALDAVFRACPHLETLSLAGCDIEPGFLGHLGDSALTPAQSDLVVTDLMSNTSSEMGPVRRANVVLHIQSQLKDLEYPSERLDVLAASASAPSSSSTLGRSILLPNLTSLNLSNCPHVSGGDLCRLVSRRRRNVPFVVRHRGEVVLEGVVAGLRSIRVDGCEGIEDAAVKWLTANVEEFSCRLRWR